MKTILAALAVLAAAFPISANADGGQVSGGPQPAPHVLRVLAQQGADFVHIGSKDGMEAYVGRTGKGQVQTFYVTPDNQAVVAGIMFDIDGVNVTQTQLDSVKNAPSE